MQMPVMSYSSKNTKPHFEKHVIITTIIRNEQEVWKTANEGEIDVSVKRLSTFYRDHRM